MLIRSYLRVLAATMIVAGASNFVARADNKPTEKPAAAAKVAGDREVMEQDEKDDETADGKGRLPVYFAKLGLTPAEKEKIQAAMAKFDDPIKKAEAEAKKLHADRDSAAEKLLSADQHKLLAKLRDEAKAARANKSAETPAKKKSKKEMDKSEKSDEKTDKK